MANTRCKCPDNGTCHHDCMATCFRVECCSPLTGVYPNNEWPPSVEMFPTPIALKGENHERT